MEAFLNQYGAAIGWFVFMVIIILIRIQTIVKNQNPQNGNK